jgi:hypothetical protein
VTVVVLDDAPRRLGMSQPRGHGGQRRHLLGMQQSLHRAAVRVPAHDDLLHPERRDGELDRRRLAARRRAMGRHDVARVAEDEQVAGARAGQQVGIDPRVRAGDEQRLRALPVGELREQSPQGTEVLRLELVDAVDEVLHAAGHGALGVGSALRTSRVHGSRTCDGHPASA